MRRAQDETCMGMSGDGFKDLVRLLYSESGIPLQKSCSMTECNVERSNWLRNAVQLNIQSIPAKCYELIRSSPACFVKSATAGRGDSRDTLEVLKGGGFLKIIV
jgi:hypothetical protein